MKKPLLEITAKTTGLTLLILCLLSCSKTDYELLDPFTAGVWTQYKTSNSEIPGNLIWEIEFDSDNMWVSFIDHGIGIYSNGSWTFYNSSNSGILNDYIFDLELKPNGDMLMGTGDGLCILTNQGEWLYMQDPVITMNIQAVKYTSEGTTWLGTEGEGLFIDWGYGFYQYKYAGFENVYAIEEDRDGNIWVGTSNGLMKYDGSTLDLEYTTGNGLPNNFVTALFCDSKNRLWVGTDGGLTVSRITRSGSIYQLYLRNGALGVSVRDICEDINGDIWFATWYDGVIKYDGVIPQSFKEYMFLENKNLNLDEDFNCVKCDNYGNIWMGSWREGLFRYSLPLE